MSGGRFNYNQYIINEIAEYIQSDLDSMGKLKPKSELWSTDEYYEKYPEDKYYPKYQNRTVGEFKEAIRTLKKAYIYAQRIDWFLSGDDGEDNFHERLKQELDKLE